MGLAPDANFASTCRMVDLSPRQAPRLWAAWGLAALSLLLVAISLVPETPLTDRIGWPEAVAHLEEKAGPDSFVIVWPPEQAAALAALPVELRAADAVPIEPPERRRYLRLHVVGPTGFDTPPELSDAEMTRDRFGDVEVATYRYAGGDQVAFDVRTDIDTVRVRLEGPSTVVTCDRRRSGGGWSCPGRPAWNHVGPTSLTVDGEDWPCVWAHPVSGRELILDLGEQRLVDRVELEAAMADSAAAMPNGAPVKLQLVVDGAGSRGLTVPNRRGVVATSLRTQRGRSGRVRVTITTPNDGRRHLGVNVRLVETRNE